MAAPGHRGGQEFGPAATLTPHSYSIFLCGAALLYFFVVYNSVLLYDLFVSSLLGGVEVAVGRAEELVEKRMAVYPKITPLPFVLPLLWDAVYLFFFFLLRSCFIYSMLAHRRTPLPPPPPRLNPCFSPFLISSASPGWETGHSCRGTASLSRVALSRPSPKHTATSYPGNRLSF